MICARCAASWTTASFEVTGVVGLVSWQAPSARPSRESASRRVIETSCSPTMNRLPRPARKGTVKVPCTIAMLPRMRTKSGEADPRIGDEIQLRSDALVEVATGAPGAPPTWRFLSAGSRGKLLGFRDRRDESRAVVDVVGTDH